MKYWKEEELKLLDKIYYKKDENARAALLKSRSQKAIYEKAADLLISDARYSRTWTKTEEERLLQNANTQGEALVKLFKNRSLAAIIAKRISLKKGYGKVGIETTLKNGILKTKVELSSKKLTNLIRTKKTRSEKNADSAI